MNKISIIICTKNSSKTIKLVIESVRKQSPKEIIVVDAHSTDGTDKIAEKLGATVHYDNGTGLGNARNIGLDKATGKYIFYMGPDNILKSNISILIKTMKHFKWSGVGLRSTILFKDSYLSRAMQLRWDKKITPGKKSVIGTPFMFARSLLKKYRFNEKIKYSDDTDLCERLSKAGRSVGYSNLDCWEVSDNSWQALKTRFKNYGISDGEYYLKHCAKWGIKRKIKSLLHPLEEFNIIQSIHDIIYVPFIMIIVVFRYIGYITKLRRGV